MIRNARCLCLMAVVLTLAMGGCKKAQPVVPDYARELPPGASALRLVEGEWRQTVLDEAAAQLSAPDFQQALGRSVDWFRLPSTQQHFPVENITHDRAQQSVQKLLALSERGDASGRAVELDKAFDVYASVGYDGSGVLLYTGYFSPQFTASRTRTGIYQHPLYTRPADLETDPATGTVLGRKTAQGTQPYPTRQQIENTDLLAGSELVFLPSRLDAYTIEVNGSAKLKLTDGSTLYVGYAGTNGREYTSIGRLLVADGALDRNTVSMPTIRQYFKDNPRKLEKYISQNERFIFFQEYPASQWPAGSLGFQVTPQRSLATDKKIFPRGGAVLATTQLPDGREFRQLMMDQDTGGAIRAPGRADVYFGIGPAAELVSGQMASEGHLFYLFLKPAMVSPSNAQ